MITYRLLNQDDYDAIHQLHSSRTTWMAVEGIQPIAGTWSLRNYWLNPERPEWELMGAFDGDRLITTRGSYWCSDLPTVFSSKLFSIEPAPFGQLPRSFIHLFRQMIQRVISGPHSCFTSLVTPRLSRIYDRALTKFAPEFDVYITRRIPPNTFTGVETIDMHLLNMTPAPYETWVRESVLREEHRASA